MDVEEALIRAFIAPERRSRYLALLASPKKRTKLLASFVHVPDLDYRFVHRLAGFWNDDALYDELRGRGAPERCYVMSASSDLDGQETDLLSALKHTRGGAWGGDGTFISCLPGRLAYFEGEPMYTQFILERPAKYAIC